MCVQLDGLTKDVWAIRLLKLASTVVSGRSESLITDTGSTKVKSGMSTAIILRVSLRGDS